MGTRISVVGRLESNQKGWSANLVGGPKTVKGMDNRAIWGMLILTHAMRADSYNLSVSSLAHRLKETLTQVKREYGKLSDHRALAFRSDIFEPWERENAPLMEQLKSEGNTLSILLEQGFKNVLNAFFYNGEFPSIPRPRGVQPISGIPGRWEIETTLEVSEQEVVDLFSSFNRDRWFNVKGGVVQLGGWTDYGDYRDPIGCSIGSEVFMQSLSRSLYPVKPIRSVAAFTIANSPLSAGEIEFLQGFPINIFDVKSEPYLELEDSTYENVGSIEIRLAAAALRTPTIDQMLYLLGEELVKIPKGHRIPIFPEKGSEGYNFSGFRSVIARNPDDHPYIYKFDYLAKEKDRLPDVAQRITELNRRYEDLCVVVVAKSSVMKKFWPLIGGTEEGVVISPLIMYEAAMSQYLPVLREIG